MRKLVYGLLGAAAFTIGSAANAAEVTIDPGTINPIASNNDFQAQLNGLGLWYIATAGTSITLDETSVITFELLGSESGYSDTFTAGGVTYTENTSLLNLFGSPLTLGSDVFLAGLLSANFSASGGASGGVGSENFGVFLPTNNGDPFNTNVFYLGYDDQITGPDDNHDDLIIRATVSTAVPEPATWAMMLLGFGVAGFALRRRRAPALAQAA